VLVAPGVDEALADVLAGDDTTFEHPASTSAATTSQAELGEFMTASTCLGGLADRTRRQLTSSNVQSILGKEGNG
jgi:hypothetical protein